MDEQEGRSRSLFSLMDNSKEKDPIKELQELTAQAGEALADDAAFDAAVREINDKLVVEELKRLDELMGISEQYELQLTVLREAGIIGILREGSDGIATEDGAWHPVPSLLSIVQRFCEDEKKYELLLRKVEQGFTKMILVPFGLPVNTLIDVYARQLLLYKQAGQLFSEGGEGEVLNLDLSRPVSRWSGYDVAQPVYFPKSFDSINHGGLTKQEAIDQKGAWQVYLIEETHIPRPGDGEVVNGRKQLEAGLTPTQYLEMLQADPQYKGEVGLTPELWTMRALTNLKKWGEVTDDIEGVGCGNYHLSTCFPEYSEVPYTCWDSDHSWLRFGADDIHSQVKFDGASTAVMI